MQHVGHDIFAGRAALPSFLGTFSSDRPFLKASELITTNARYERKSTMLSILWLVFTLASGIAADVEATWHVSWALWSPWNEEAPRPVMMVNNETGSLSPPAIRATVGEQITIHLYNDLGNASTSMHFHGLFQAGSNHMDGASGATQCPIPPGSSFTYSFRVCVPVHTIDEY